MNTTKRLVAFLLTVVMLLGLLPVTALAEDENTNQVYVTVENTTFPVSDGAAWDGMLVGAWVDIDDDSTMMSAVVSALDTIGATAVGAESNYISSINELAAFDGGTMSGWMGTLNDWFTNEGFGAYTVAAGTLEAGDEISIMYTVDYGEDLGGSWSNNDKTVKDVAFSTGILSPGFDKDTHNYTLTVPEGTEGIVVTPTVTNKNFQVRTSIGTTEYKRMETVPVENGTVITVKCGDPEWPTMNGGDYGTADSIPAETYSITVALEGGGNNTAPALQDGVAATAEETVTLGDAYTLDLSTIFVDADGDTLEYKVSIDGADAVTAEESYSYTPEAAGEYTLVFAANDGMEDSTDTYTMTLTVGQASDAWDGSVDTSWYNTTDTSFTIENGAQFAGFAAIVSGTASGIAADSFSGKTVTLAADINLNNEAWTSIGLYSSAPFEGMFDGNGKKISNLSITATANYTGALFSYNNGTIKNLTIESGSITSDYRYTASLVSRNYGKVINCLNKASVTSSGTYTGGLVAYNRDEYAFIVNSANDGSVTSTSTSSSVNAGGISGFCSSAYVINCYNTGDIESTNNKNRVGGIVGSSLTGKVSNCYNCGNVISSGSQIGAILGRGSEANLANGTAVLANCYFLQTDSVNSGLDPVGDGIEVSDIQAKAVGSSELAGLADTLGGSFAADTQNINSGYPVLAWQNTGVYDDPTEESLDGLAVTAVSAASNGSVTVTLDRELIFTKLSESSFSATISVGGAEAETLTLTGISQCGASVALSFDALAQETSDQAVTVSVGYQGGEKKSGGFTLYADPDWLIYAEKPAVGDGSAESPYRIGTAAELAWFSALVNGELTDGTPQDRTACAILTADISLNDTTGWESWDKDTEGIKCWTPIGHNNSDSYLGKFDGQGYTISGLYISDTDPEFWCIGLFGYVQGEDAYVKNVNVRRSYICHINSNWVSVKIGTIAGKTEKNTIENCSAEAHLDIKGYYPYVGGIVGIGSANGCCFDGNVTLVNTSYSSCYVGGVVGSNGNGSILNCYNRGTVSVSTCYSGGTEKKTDYAGGIAGKGTYIAFCYSTGSVSCSSGEVNALFGTTYDTTVVLNSYYPDTAGTDSYGEARTEAEFTDGTIAGLLGEAYTTDANINGGYPCLVWQTQEPGGVASEVSAPVITMEGGGLADTVTFKISCETEGAAIYYTTDGSVPTAESSVYTEDGVTLSEGTVRAIAIKEGLEDSAISSETVSAVVDPEITPGTCVISGETVVTISTMTPDADIYYTTDGTSPLSAAGYALTASAIQYTGSFTVGEDKVITAIALKTGMLKSGIVSEEYTCNWLPYAQQPAQDGEGAYLIGTAEELSWFAGLVNGTLSGVAQNTNASAKLTADISLAGHVWKPIGWTLNGDSIGAYAGIFDGGGHTVSGMEFDNIVDNQSASRSNGLFAYNRGTIKNVCIAGEMSVRGACFGAVCASNTGTISNCRNTGTITSDHKLVGGICGVNKSGGVICCSYNTGTIRGEKYPDWTSGIMANYLGGICGQNYGEISDCYNTGALTCMFGTGRYWGNIVGDVEDGGTVLRCYSLGMLTEGCHRDIYMSDMGGWQLPEGGGGNSATLAGGDAANTVTIAASYYLENVSKTGDQLNSVALSDMFRAYPSHMDSSSYGFAGYRINASDASKIDMNGTYYAFYDVTNDQIIALKLDGDGDGGDVVIDATDLGDVSFSGTTGQYMARTTKTFYVVTVPADTANVKFTNTDELQDFTFYLEDERATKITSENASGILTQVQNTWPDAYDAIETALANAGGAEPDEPVEGEVYVTVENTTFPVSDGADWDGVLVETWVDIDDDSTMMSAVVSALDTIGATAVGAESNYISSINELEAFDGGTMSGWMGTLNDWFTNEGFGAYTVAAGTLEAGDEISIMYTVDYGEDLGGSWSNNDKTVKDVAFSTGILSPGFDKDTHNYTLTVPEGTEGIVVTPTATNKNFQVRTSIGTTEYKRTETVPVENGTVITVKCGDPEWPTMNGGDYGTADSIPAETYSITVALEGGGNNTAPALQDGVAATAEETVTLGDAYTLDLSTIFVDADGDTLEYKVSIDGADAVTAEESYSYTPEAAGEYTLVFAANDGMEDSTDTYTVTLVVDQPTTFMVDGQAVVFEDAGWYYKATVTVHGNFTVSVTADSDVNIAGSLSGTGTASKEFTPTSAKTTVRVILQQGTGAGVMYYIYAEQAQGEKPVITTDLSTDVVEYPVGSDADALSVTVADLTDGGTLSYQWYSSMDNETFAPINGATESSYIPSADAEGTIYYKVVVTNTFNFTEVTTESQVAEVKVTEQESAKLASLLIHTAFYPSEGAVLMKNEGDEYDTEIVFDPDTLSYTLEPQTDSLTRLRFQALAADDGATVMIYYGDGKSKDITWTSGSSKAVKFLTAGRNVFTIVVTPPDGSGKQETTYTFTIDCLPTLSDISVTTGNIQLYLDETFSKEKTSYSITVPGSAETMDISATPTSDEYMITYNESSSNTVDISSVDKIDVVVTGGDGENELSNTYTINITKVAQLDFSVIVTPDDAVVKVYDQNGISIGANSDGSFSGMFGASDYTYTATKYGYVAQGGVVPATGGTIDVKLAAAADDGLADVGAYWSNFRGSEDNMAITDVELPIKAETTSLIWNAQLGSGWSAAPSVQIIVDDALVVLAGTTIYKLDLVTGETLETGTMAAAPNWGYTPPIYAEGMIFAPLTDGTIQAFNAQTLESLWVYTDSLGGQSLSPIAYEDGYIYTGFWKGEDRDAHFVCLSVTDEDITQTDEAKTATWLHTQKGGFYWAGAVVVGDAVIVGTDDGASGCNSTSKLYAFDQFTGNVISALDITGDQRSSIAYDAAAGKVYFTTKCGYLYCASVDASTGVLSNLKGVNHDAQSTSTPVVYDGKVYIGVGSGITSTGSSGNLLVADADSLEMLYAVGLKGYPQCSMLLTTAYEEETGYIYLYSTYNSTPGGISMIKIDSDATTADGAELIELYDASGFSQYCISSIICSKDGILYYKNDSGNVLAVGVPEAENVIELINAIGEVTLDSGNAIAIARDAYDALPDDQKADVTNYATLLEAESTYSALQVEYVETLINKIGVVTIDSGDAISAARDAYDALTDTQKVQVGNYASLTAAEVRYAEIMEDMAAAGAVDDLINAIGTVTLESKGAIAAARSAYDDLTYAQKLRVTQYDTLTAAEARYNELVDEAEQKEIDEAAAKGVEELIDAIGDVTLNSEADIAAARAGYNALTSTQKSLVSNYAILVAAEAEFAELERETTEQVTVTLEDEDVAEGGGTVSVSIDGVTYEVDSQIAAVMTQIESVGVDENGKPDINDVISVYLAYQDLTDDQKLFVANYDELEAYMQALAEQNHTDGQSGISVSVLDWYIQVAGTAASLSSEEAAALQEALGENTLIVMYDITLYDMINDMEYEPEGPLEVRLPAPDMEGYDGVVIVHRKDDGTIEYIEATIDGDELIFTATGFSFYGVVGYMGRSPMELGAADWSWLIWLGIGVVLIAALIALLILRKRKAEVNI